ncbi:IS1/IS1595 family N-terminal zinc-binding domain-containing protein [Pleurocapsa sp. FMAR1]|uniref:IS1/IS1595 family N-terminal zinc-binding domain-containing protein n=1 Tax=Pleurocapsa sp. FMAR1 TaxID=3040204 RepID=UPI0029C8AEB0|nr:hypothetical protein [Pleurocapsa sp. FMAR1]
MSADSPPYCPSCESNLIVKNGKIHNGKQPRHFLQVGKTDGAFFVRRVLRDSCVAGVPPVEQTVEVGARK